MARASEGPNLARVDRMIGFPNFASFYGRSNDVFGAVPSLHVAYPLLIMIEGWRRFGSLMRAASVAFFVTMMFAAVYLDHHWIVDVVLGVTYALAVLCAVRAAWAHRRRASDTSPMSPSSRITPVQARASFQRYRPMVALARAVTRSPVPIVAIAVLLTAVSVWKLRSFDATSFEYDFSKLRRKDTWVSGEGYWGDKMDNLLGTYLTPIVIVTDGPAETTAVEAALRERMKSPPLSDMLDSVRTFADLVPTAQHEKIEKTREIRELLTPAMRALVPPEHKADLDRFVGRGDPTAFAAKDLPRTFTVGMLERDGTMNRAVLVFPKPSHALWEGPSIAGLVSALREAASAGPGPPARVAGALPVSADILSSIQRDGPKASLAAFLIVVLVMFALFRFGFTSAVVLTALVLGVAWLAGLTLLSGVKINFSNFIAFPITFGIGVDYAVNVMTRYVSDGKSDVAAAIRSTGGAVGLCSLTTIIGYSSLLMAANRALFLFGALAVLGELTCLAVAILALPAALTLLDRRRRHHAGTPHRST